MGRKIIIQAIGPGLHQLLEPGRAAGIVGLQPGRIDEQALAQILPDRLLALGFGKAAQVDQIIGLDPVEVVFGLGIDHAEHGVGVGRAMDMGDAPLVAGDGDLGRRERGRRLGKGRAGGKSDQCPRKGGGARQEFRHREGE